MFDEQFKRFCFFGLSLLFWEGLVRGKQDSTTSSSSTLQPLPPSLRKDRKWKILTITLFDIPGFCLSFLHHNSRYKTQNRKLQKLKQNHLERDAKMYR